MIYQCFFKEGQQAQFFKTEPYVEFGLEPEVNLLLTRNCPELEDASVRLQLTEYACLLWHWRNPAHDQDPWIGTTSYRQLEKTPFVFRDKQDVAEHMGPNQISGWGFYQMLDIQGQPISIARQAEACHPGINEFIQAAFLEFGYSVPQSFHTESTGLFANYWVMNKRRFNEYMEFSWPIVRWALAHRGRYDYFKNEMPGNTVSNAKAIGYFVERLFIIWYLTNGYQPTIRGPVTPLVHS